MGDQIIRQPDGLYCIYSSMVDNFVVFDATPNELTDYFLENMTATVAGKVGNIIYKLDMDEKPYFQFTMSFEEALRKIEEVHGYKPSIEKYREEAQAERIGITKEDLMSGAIWEFIAILALVIAIFAIAKSATDLGANYFFSSILIGFLAYVTVFYIDKYFLRTLKDIYNFYKK